MNHSTIKIELLSDLCISSGYAYAGIVDQDVCYDKYGIPFIPARRLKGCLKDAAELIKCLISSEEYDRMFGVAKSNEIEGIIVDNARIKNYGKIVEDLEKAYGTEELSALVTVEGILDEFTRVRGQTALVEGVADETSLRYIRTVNQYSPVSEDENLCFYADVYYNCEEETLRQVVEALRHIGYYRNRGLGNVRCTLQKPSEENCENFEDKWTEGENLVFELTNEEPLMISSESNAGSLTYIPGRNLIGALAALYLNEPNHSADSQFEDLFLNGKVKYSNVYVCEDHKRSIPVPDFIRRMKKSEKYINILNQDADKNQNDAEYNPSGGNQPKKLKGKYLTLNNNQIRINSVETEIIYHHRHVRKKGDPYVSKEIIQDEQLYTQTAVSSGQTFRGCIEGDPEDLKIIHNLLLNNRVLRFGKSKSAQYGKCGVTGLYDAEKEKEYTVENGEILLVSAASDLIFLNSNTYTVNFKEVYEKLAEELGMKDCYEKLDEHLQLNNSEDSAVYSLANVTTVYGYNCKWNLRRSPVPAIAAGSTFVYRIKEKCTVKQQPVGEFTFEGNGEIRIFKLNDMPYRLKVSESEKKVEALKDNSTITFSKGRQLICKCLEKSLEEKIMSGTQKKCESGLQLSASKVGRLTLMLKESIKSSSDPEKQYKDMRKRVNSIKSVNDNKEALFVLDRLIGSKAIETKKILKDCNAADEYNALKQLEGEAKVNQIIRNLWKDVLMNYLTIMKYSKKA